jgi:cobalt-zinc-cadmium efflux system outer membrane protein
VNLKQAKVANLLFFSYILLIYITVYNYCGAIVRAQSNLSDGQAIRVAAIDAAIDSLSKTLPSSKNDNLQPTPAESVDKTKKGAVLSLSFGGEPTAANPPAVDNNTLRHLSLEKATELLIQNNLPIIAARNNVTIAQAQRIAASFRPAPSVTVTFNNFVVPRIFLHPRNLIKTGDGNAANNSSYTVEYDRLIERGGKREQRIAQADASAKAAEAMVEDAIRQQIFQLKQAFLSAALARENLKLAADNLAAFEKSEKILFAQVSEGYSAGVDLKRVQLQELQYQTAVAQAEQSYQQAARDVFNLIGVGDAPSLVNDVRPAKYDLSALAPQLEANLDVIEGDLEIAPVVLWINDVRRLALENRPDIKAAKLNLEAAEANLRLAQAARRRDITVGTQFSRVGSDNAFGFVATVPLEIKKRAENAIGQAAVVVKQAQANLRQAQTQALTEVEKAFLAYLISRDRLRLYTGTALKNARDVRQIEQIAYGEGAKGLLEFLDAQRVYNQTLLDYNQSRYDFLVSLAQLEAATGTKLPH